MKRHLMPTAFLATVLPSTTIGFVFVVFIVLTAVGSAPQALAQELCPASPAYTPDFSSNRTCLTPNDNAAIVGGEASPFVLQLTPNLVNQTGSAWYNTLQVVQNGFTTNFQFQLTPAGGADGIAFVIQNSSTSAIGFTGGNGGALGYGDADASTNPSTGAGIPNSLAIEFDVFQNSWDLAGSHVAVQSCGTGPNTSHHDQFCGGDGPNPTLGAPVLTSSSLADGNVHTVTIKYSVACPSCTPSTSANKIHVILDGTDMNPGGVDVDLASLLTLGEGGTAYVGFTGATGALTETQNILSWTFSSTSSAPETTFTTPSQTTTQGGSNQFTDPGGSGTTQTYVFPKTTTFSNDQGGSCTSPTMAIQFQYWDPTVFNSSRLPGIPQNPNWCSVPGNPGLACSTPVPAQTTCAQLSVDGKNYCIVEEAQCSCGGTQQAHCNVTGVSGPILVSNANNNYASPAPVNPGLVIGDDGQNNWAIMPQAPDGATCTTNCSTTKLNTDITILDVHQPDFSFTATSPLNPSVGGSAASTVTLSALYGFTGLVALSVPNPPAGVITSFSSPSVTPPDSPSSVTSTLTVTPLTTGSFTLDVEGNNGTPPTNLTHFAFVTVNVAANTSTSGISSVITTLLNNNCIDNAGIANALTSKLTAAQGFISVSKNQDAINTLTALNNQINAQSGKHIHTTCTISGSTFNPVTILTTDVQTLINSLRVGVLGDPITGYALNSSGAAIQGATVSIVSGASTIATATTDITGFYYFATTNLLKSGSTYIIKVSGLAGYSTATPTSSTFTWSGTLQNFNFTLN